MDLEHVEEDSDVANPAVKALVVPDRACSGFVGIERGGLCAEKQVAAVFAVLRIAEVVRCYTNHQGPLSRAHKCE